MGMRNRQQTGGLPSRASSLLNPVTTGGEDKRKNEEAQKHADPPSIMLPLNYAVPENADSISLWNIEDIAPGVTGHILLEFTAAQAGVTRILKYALFTNALGGTDIEFLPTRDGVRAYPYHGNPMNSGKITQPLTDNLGDGSLVNAPITLLPGQTVRWLVSNNSLAVASCGVRIFGYVDQNVLRHQHYINPY
jgi:hypothetical protein